MDGRRMNEWRAEGHVCVDSRQAGGQAQHNTVNCMARLARRERIHPSIHADRQQDKQGAHEQGKEANGGGCTYFLSFQKDACLPAVVLVVGLIC